MRSSSRARGIRGDRRGSVTVEIAIALPILITVIIGIVESCNIIYLKHSLNVAAYEGVRAAVGPAPTTTDVTARASQVLVDRNVSSGSISVSPDPPSSTSYGNYVSVEVTAPYAGNSVLPGFFFGGITLKGKVIMMKEY